MTSAIDTNMLAAMRAAISDLLPDTAQIITITRTQDSQGGWTESRATATAVAFRLDIISGREQVSGGAIQPFTSAKGSLPYDTTITNTNQLLHGGITYAVKTTNNDQSWKAVVRVDLEKI